MDNQEAIKILGQYDVSDLHFYTTDGEEIPFTEWSDAIEMAISALQAQYLQPSDPTLYGYKIEHLSVIAEVLQKEGLPPDRVVDALTDIDRIISIVVDEFEDSSQKVSHPDLSGYSDKLWRSAYERGKAEARTEMIEAEGRTDEKDRTTYS